VPGARRRRRAAQRRGLVTVATPASQQHVVAGLVREAMTEPLPETGARTFALKAREVVAELAAPRDAVALGPGIGLDEETRARRARWSRSSRSPWRSTPTA